MIARPSAILLFSCQKIPKDFIRSYSVTTPLKMALKDINAALAKAHDFIDFVNASPTRT
jgi:hypothetical protein